MRQAIAIVVLFVLLVVVVELANPTPEPIDLGAARYPATAGVDPDVAAVTAAHAWRASERDATYRLAYVHGEDAMATLEADHAAFGRSLGFAWNDALTFRWQVPGRCRGREWGCIYGHVLTRSKPDLEPVLARMADALGEGEWTATDAARWLLAFVQAIPYEEVEEHAFGIVPPPLVASNRSGDCDSKALLLLLLLERVGIDAMLLTSEAHAHAVVGVAVPTGMPGFRHRGREYAWAETTAESAPLGWIHPRVLRPDDWEVVALP